MKAPSFSIVCFFISIVLSLSCGQSFVDSGEDGVTSFPLHTGDRWEYIQTDYQIPFGGQDSEITATSRIIRRVIGMDTATSTFGLIMVDDSLTFTYQGNEEYTTTYRSWRRVTDNDMIEIAFWRGFPEDRHWPIFRSHPYLLLDFPLSSGKNWVMEQNSFGLSTMTVVDFQDYRFGDKSYYCALVRTAIDSLPQVSITDWYSNSGLIFSHTDYGMNYINDEIGHIIDSIYLYQDIRISSINLVE